MITTKIVELIAQRPMTSQELMDTMGIRRTVMFSTLTYLYKRGLIDRDPIKKLAAGKGRKTIYIYRANDATTQNATGLDVGQQGAVSQQSEGAASS
jgi:predicted transcriptional regulator